MNLIKYAFKHSILINLFKFKVGVRIIHKKRSETGHKSDNFRSSNNKKVCKISSRLDENCFSLHMHAKPSFAHRLPTAKMAFSRTSA